MWILPESDDKPFLLRLLVLYSVTLRLKSVMQVDNLNFIYDIDFASHYFISLQLKTPNKFLYFIPWTVKYSTQISPGTVAQHAQVLCTEPQRVSQVGRGVWAISQFIPQTCRNSRCSLSLSLSRAAHSRHSLCGSLVYSLCSCTKRLCIIEFIILRPY